MSILQHLHLVGAVLASGSILAAADGSVAGTLSTPHPTTCGISIVWPFSGDADRDARVTVRYRTVGGAWRTGMPLFRVPAGSTQGVAWGDRHLGSLFDLQPASAYEIELTLADPDGGSVVRSVTATTRALPEAMAGARIRTATPANLATQIASLVPGDVLELSAGSYPGFTLGTAGEAARPIVIRSAAGAVIDGMIELGGARHVQLQGLTINGRVRINNTLGIAITRCTINTRVDRGESHGIAAFLRSEDAYIADNTLVGTSSWNEAALGVSGANQGEGICLTGPGHVIRNNRVRGFRDGISLMEYDEAVDQYSIDIIENEISECPDDGIEADFAAGNVRVMRNRLTNCFMGISSQPGLGGPLYLVRNAMYNIVFEAFKLHNDTYGDVLVNNTVVKSGDAFSVFSGAPISRLWSRNNLFIGGPGGTYGGYTTGSGKVMNLVDLTTASVSMDYDGFGSTAGFFQARFGPSLSVSSLSALRNQTTEVHAVQVGLGVFAAAVAYPAAPMTIYAAADLRLASAGAAVDVATPVPGITDGFAGAAPDLGAYEVGAAVPAYGPRSPETSDITPPVITTPATGPGSVVGTTAVLSVAASDDLDAALLTYTWTIASWSGGGASGAVFSPNGSNAAHSATVTFHHAGSYTCTVMVRDGGGNTVTSTTGTIVVVQTPTAVVITEASPVVTVAETVVLHATLRDQFADAISAGTTTWAVIPGGAGGSVAADGSYTAPASPTVWSENVRATIGGLSSTVTVHLTSGGGVTTRPYRGTGDGGSCGVGGTSGLLVSGLFVLGLRCRRRGRR